MPLENYKREGYSEHFETTLFIFHLLFVSKTVRQNVVKFCPSLHNFVDFRVGGRTVGDSECGGYLSTETSSTDLERQSKESEELGLQRIGLGIVLKYLVT